MATYQVQAPDGKTITLEGPDGASHEDVIAQAQSLYKPPAASAPAADPKPRAPAAPKPQDAKNAWDQGSALLEQRIANLPAAAQKIARDRFFADPRIARLREQSAAPVANSRFDVRKAQASAKQRSQDNASTGMGGFLAATKAGLTRGAFGIPERIAAKAQSLLGDTGGLSEQEILEQVRANTDADLDRNTAGNFLGQIISGGAIGGAALKGVQAVARAVPAIGGAAEAITAAAPRISKVLAMTGAGAAGGAAQALGEGSDVGTGATVGAIAAPALHGLGKAAGYLMRPVGDMLGLPNAGKILQRFTTADAGDIRRAADEYRQTTGAEPTLYELLPLEDRNNLAKDIIGRTPKNSEQTAAAVRQRVSNVGPELGQTVQNATAGRRAQIVGQMEQDLDNSRALVPENGPPVGVPDPNDTGVAARAATSPVDLKNLQRGEANATMAPVANDQVAENVESIYPRSLHRNPETGVISEVYSDPEVNDALRNAAGVLRLRPRAGDDSANVAGLTGDDVTRMLRQLAKVPAGTPQAGAAQRAGNVVMDHLESQQPQAARQIARMRESWANRARQIEGMAEGARTRTRESIPVENTGQAQIVRNAFDTPEGNSGRFLGQSNKLGRDFAGTPEDALRAAGNVAESGQTQAALRGNLGADAANAISGAAEVQGQSVRNLAAVGKETGQKADSLDLQDLGRLVLALNPAAMPTTKLFALSRLTTLTRLPQKKATQLIDMMFSQDPAVTNRAIAMLNNAGDQGRTFLADISRSLNVGARAGQMGQALTDEQQGGTPGLIPEANAAEPSQDIQGDFIDPEAPPADPNVPPADDQGEVPYGHRAIQEIFPEAHITSDHRGPDNDIYDPNSGHAGYNAVDVRPIPGMTYEEFLDTIREAGHEIVKAYDESERPADPKKARAWGPHWHVEIA